MRLACAVVALVLLAVPCRAAPLPCPPEPGLTPAQSLFPQPVAVGWLSGRVVLAPMESQPVLARLREVRRGADGQMQAVLLRGGFLARFDPPWGTGTRSVAVPVRSLALLGEDLVLVGLSEDELEASPPWSGGGAPVAPDTLVCVGLTKPAH